MWSVCEEAEHARQELRAAKAAVHEMHHKNLATSLMSSNVSDVAGLLSDTPIAPHMRIQVAKCVREKLSRCDEGERLVIQNDFMNGTSVRWAWISLQRCAGL
jgi:hypothetical protein